MSAELETTTQDEAEVAFAAESQIKDAIRRGKEAIWDLSEGLYWFDEMHGWLKLGYENLSDWLADPEVTLTLGTYRRYVRTWRKLVIDKQIEADRVRALEPSKAAIVVDKVAKNEVQVDDAFADVEALGARDLREKYLAKPRESNVEQNPATSEPETSGQVLPDEDEPTRADMLATIEVIDGVLPPYDGPSEGDVIEVEVLDALPVDDYDWPAWMTAGGVKKLLENLRGGVDSGAAWPRCVTRRDCEVAIELAQAWLARHQNS